jgi:hypothetical protein
MQDECSKISITITNVVEGKNFVNYYLITDAICSYIQFYFNNNGRFSTAMPKTFECDNDTKLELLLQNLLQITG